MNPFPRKPNQDMKAPLSDQRRRVLSGPVGNVGRRVGRGPSAPRFSLAGVLGVLAAAHLLEIGEVLVERLGEREKGT